MKTSEIKKCVFCKKGIAHAGHITFWTASLQRMGLDRQAINRVGGMEQFFGGEVAIARVFCDEDIAVKVGDPTQVFVCEECATKPHMLWELLPEKDGDDSEAAA